MTARLSRSAFALNGLVLALGVCLIAVLVLKLAVVTARPVPGGGAYAAGAKIGTYAAPIGVLGIVALFGWITHRVTGRSDGAANSVMGIVISLFLAGFGYQVYLGWNKPKPATAQRSPSTPQEWVKQQTQQAQPFIDQHTSRPAPTPPPQPRPSSNPPANPAPLSSAPTPRPAPKPPQTDPNVQAQLDSLRNAITTQISQAITTLDPAIAAIAKPPRSDLADLRKRAALIKAAREALAPLPDRLHALTDEAKTAAEQGGSENALRDAIEFSNKFGAFERSSAAGQLLRLLDQASSETQVLTDNYGRWKLNKEGQIESKEFQLQSSANSDRFFINTALKDKDRTLRELRGE